MSQQSRVMRAAATATAVKMYPDRPEHAALPDNYLQHAKEFDTPILFVTGKANRVFTDSNIVCFDRLKALAPDNRHELLIIDGYGHQASARHAIQTNV